MPEIPLNRTIGVGAGFKTIRERFGVTQQEVATALEVTRLTYHQKENNKRSFTIDEFIMAVGLFDSLIKTINAEKTPPK